MGALLVPLPLSLLSVSQVETFELEENTSSAAPVVLAVPTRFVHVPEK